MHQEYENELLVHKLLVDHGLSEAEIERRYSFFHEHQSVSIQKDKLQTIDPVLVSDFEQCIQRHEDTQKNHLNAKSVLLVTYYTELRPLTSLSAQHYTFLKQSIRILHDIGVQHGDVHFGNIMYNAQSNTPILIDWGSAEFTASDIDEKSLNNVKQQFLNEELHQARKKKRSRLELYEDDLNDDSDSENSPKIKRGTGLNFDD